MYIHKHKYTVHLCNIYIYEYKIMEHINNATIFSDTLGLARFFVGFFPLPKRRSTMWFTRFHWDVLTGWSLTLLMAIRSKPPTVKRLSQCGKPTMNEDVNLLLFPWWCFIAMLVFGRVNRIGLGFWGFLLFIVTKLWKPTICTLSGTFHVSFSQALRGPKSSPGEAVTLQQSHAPTPTPTVPFLLFNAGYFWIFEKNTSWIGDANNGNEIISCHWIV